MTFPEEFNPNEMYPVFIILSNKRNSFFERWIKILTRGEYSHVAICIDRSFNKIYQIICDKYKKALRIGPYNQPFYLQEDNNCSIYVGWVGKSSYELMKSKLNYYASQIDNIRYSLLSAVFAYFNKAYTNKDVNIELFCSEFVALILNMDKQRTNKNSHIVLPEDFKKEGRFQLIYKGPTKNMNPKKINEAAEIAKKVVIARGSYDSYIMEERYMFSDGYNDFTDFVEESLIEFDEYGEIAEEGTSMDALKTVFGEDYDKLRILIKDAKEDCKNGDYVSAKSKLKGAKDGFKKLSKDVNKMEDSWFDSIVSDAAIAGLVGLVAGITWIIIPVAPAAILFSALGINTAVAMDKDNLKAVHGSIAAAFKRSWSKSFAVMILNRSAHIVDKLIKECGEKSKK